MHARKVDERKRRSSININDLLWKALGLHRINGFHRINHHHGHNNYHQCSILSWSLDNVHPPFVVVEPRGSGTFEYLSLCLGLCIALSLPVCLPPYSASDSSSASAFSLGDLNGDKSLRPFRSSSGDPLCGQVRCCCRCLYRCLLRSQLAPDGLLLFL